jgi:Caspase domain/Sel1 repeat
MAHTRPTAVAALALALALAFAQSGDPAHAKKTKATKIESADDLRIVDCLLPGKIRRLGRNSQYVTARQPLRTTAVDCEIRGGDYVLEDRGSYASALKVWLASAEGGDAKAQTYVGEIFEKGLAGTPDYQAAAQWYRKAAEQGFSRGQINLAQLYEKGLGVPADREQALSWYRKAAGISEEVVLDSRAEAEALRQELESATEQATKLEQQLTESEASLEAARSELEATRAEMEQLRQKLEQAKSSQPAADVERLASELERRQSEVARRSQEVDRRAEDVAGRREAFEAFRSRVAKIRSSAGHGAGPTIEIVRPDVLATRGPALVPVPPGVRELEVTGKVTAPSGLEALTVDEQPLTTDADGFFNTSVAASGRREVRFVAIDRAGRDATATLILEPQAEGARPVTPSGARPRGGGSPVDRGAPGGAYHALIIGVSGYAHFPPLATAASDAEELARILSESYGFSTRTLKDPSHLALLIELKSLADSLGPQDRLLIYYAGHGKIDDASGRGYWIPADAEPDDDSKWIANETVSEYLDLIPAGQILVISDSCYSGTMTRSGLARRASPGEPPTPAAAGAPAAGAPAAGKRSRTVLTSGGLQPVLDSGGGEHSLFARALLTVLELNDRPLPGAALHREVAARVTFAASELGVEQVPDYAPIQFAGHETGDFVLVPGAGAPPAAAVKGGAR